jgi:decaprenyl-phosphate phosphoribosyltransferase
VLALLRYAVNVDAGHGEEPEELILHDRMLLGLGVVWAATLVAATFI